MYYTKGFFNIVWNVWTYVHILQLKTLLNTQCISILSKTMTSVLVTMFKFTLQNELAREVDNLEPLPSHTKIFSTVFRYSIMQHIIVWTFLLRTCYILYRVFIKNCVFSLFPCSTHPMHVKEQLIWVYTVQSRF